MRTLGTSGASPESQPPEPSASWQDYTELKEMLKALGDNARLNIVHALSTGGEVKVTELALMLAVSQPLVSWHLAILRRHGVVRTRRSGREVYCSLDLERFRRCQRLLAGIVESPSASAGTGGPGPPQHQPTQEAQEPRQSSADSAPGGSVGATANLTADGQASRRFYLSGS